jgi:DsbC/DsbD-like thiol-disulfide interchange protein/cytochrome c biogenesis protein CcdA
MTPRTVSSRSTACGHHRVLAFHLTVLFGLLSLFVFSTPLQAQVAPVGPAPALVKAQHLAVSLVVPAQQLAQGTTVPAALHFSLDPGWHIYWFNAGDSGEPPTVRWTLPPGVTADAFAFPAPRRLPLGPLMDFGYEQQVSFPLSFQVSDAAVLGPAQLSANIDWLVCREVCLPGKAALSITRSIVPTGTTVAIDPLAKATVDAGLASLPRALPSGAIQHFMVSKQGITLAVTFGTQTAHAQFFPADPSILANAAAQAAAPIANGVRLQLARDPSAPATLAALRGVLVLPSGSTYQVNAIPGPIPPVVATAPSAVGAEGLLQAIVWAFGGGIILNLMPCVFPVLFLKGLSLLNSSSKQRHAMRLHGWVYTLGILVSFWLVVAVLLVLRGAGQSLGWGFQFQSPIFLAVMALFLFFLALSLAGQFEVGLSLTSTGGSLAQREGYSGSFFTGVLAMVVATPCTAPLMGVAVGYALAHSALISFAIFTALGLGLATPYLLLAYNPGWTRILPRPGAWMEVLKQIIAVPIFATVIWLIWVFTQNAGVNALLGLLAGFLLLAVAGAILGRYPARRSATIVATVVALLAVALPVYAVQLFGAPLTAASAATGPGTNWKPFSPEAVADARAHGHPVFVDFTASWCLSCQVNERVVLDRADVQKRLNSSGVVLLKADWTRHDASIGQALAALGRSGIPTYALYPASPTAQPFLLPEVLTPGAVYTGLQRLQ